MNRIHNTLLIISLFAAFLIAGCGGGGAFSVAEGGIGGTGISTGTVTGIGSITVNGVKFNTDNAAIYIEGVRVDDQCISGGNETCLRDVLGFNEGQVVRVVGSFNDDGKTGTADAVYYNDTIEGPVEVGSIVQIDASTLRLVVMGQTVVMNNETKLFDTTPAPITLNGINEGDLIEVSGLIDEQNRIQAGYVLNKGTYNSGDSVEIKGIIDTGSITQNNFRINGLLIDYSAVIPVPSLQDGMQVEVKGTYNGTHIVAVSVEQDDDISGRDDDDVEYEGIVTTAPVGIDFVMGVQPVQVSPNTIYKGGLVEDITVGVRLEIEGYLQGGVLLADEVRFRDAIKIDAPVATSSRVNDVITVEFTGLTPPITVQVNEISKIEDDSGIISIDQLETILSSGETDYIQVRGRKVSTGVIFAEEIEVESPIPDDPPRIKLQGPVEQVDDINFIVTILGIDVDASNISENNFEGVNDQSIGRDLFFSTVVPGNIVEAQGEWDEPNTMIIWEELGLEDED